MSKGILPHDSLLAELPAIEYSQLYENRAMLEALLSYIPEGILIASAPHGDLILMNRAGEDLRGAIPPSTPLKEYSKYWELYYPNGLKVAFEELPLSCAFRGESVNQKEYIVKFPNQETRHQLISSGPLRKGNGEIFASIVIFSDLTEQKHAEEALQDSERRYRELFEKATDIIYSHDLAGKLLSFNKAASDLFGYTKAEKDSLNINQIIAPESLEETRNMVRRKLLGQDTPAYQLDAITKQGERLSLEVNTILILEDGKPVGIQGIARNITERKRKDDSVRMLKERFSTAFNASPFPIGIIKISDSRCLDINESALRQTGFSRQEALGKTIYELGIAQDRERFTRFWKSFLAQGAVRDFELEFQTKSGEKRLGLFSAERIDIDGELCALISEIDITEQRRAERVKAATYEISEAANSAENLQELFEQIHQIVSALMYAKNFYIALLDPEAGLLRIPYFVDEFDHNPQQRTLRRGLTEYVMRTEKPLHALPQVIEALEASGEVEAIGTLPADWFGVPLKTKDKTIGVLAVQSYTQGLKFGDEEQKILIFVSTQVAIAIERRRAEEALRTSQEWFSKVFNLSPNPMGINRLKDGRYVDVNNSLLEITGHRYDEIIGKTPDDLNTWASPELKKLFLELLSQRKKIHNLESDFQTKFGDMRFGLVSAEIIEANGEEFVLTSISDITKRKLAEDALRTSEQKLSLHLQQTPLGAIEWNNSFEITDWNQAAEKIFGYSKEEMMGKHPIGLLIRDEGDIYTRWQARLERKVGWQRTFKNFTRDRREIICEWYNTPLIDEQGNVMGVASLVQDITERKRAEEALMASEERFSKAFNLSPLPMHIISLEDTRYIYVNDSFVKATGYTREEMLGKTGDELNLWVSKAEREKVFQTFNETGKIHNLEIEYRRKDGEIRTGLGASEMITLDGKPCALSVLNDITERKRAEEALMASEERFSKAFNLSPLPMSLISLKDGKIIDVNDSFLKTTGYFRKEVIGKTSSELNLWVQETDRQLGIQLIKEKQQIYNLEGRYRRKDGAIRTILFSAETINLGNDPCILCVLNDITERKRAEEALMASEERFSKAFNLSPLPMHIVSIKDGTYIAVNDSFLKVTGYSRAEVIGKTGTELNLWASQEDRKKTAIAIRESGRLDNVEMGYRRKNGEIRTTLVSSEILTLGGEACALTVINDITERKHEEAALKASEERFSTAFYLSPNPMCISTLEEGRFIDVNDAFALALLARREELIGRTSREVNFFVDYAQRDESIKLVQNKRKYEADNIEVRYNRMNGETRTGLLSAEVINIEGTACLLTVVNDITERKKQEEELLTVRREWQATFDALSDTVMLIDRNDRLVRANKAFFERSGLPFDQVIGHPVREISHRDNQFISADDCPLCELRSKKISGTIELPAGVISNFPILASVDPIFDSEGEFAGCVQVTRSLSALYTAREEAEQERISLKATIEQMAEGLMIFDESALVVRANSSAQSIFGFTLEQMLADRGSALIIGRFSDKSGRLIPLEEQPVQTALRQQQTVREATLWYTRPDRQRIFLSVTASPFFNEQGKLTGVVSIVRDITQQQRELERLQQADKLRALGQLASGVAHNFNNALAAVIGYSQLAIRKTTDTEVEKYLRVIEQSSKDAARMVERIQNFSRTSFKQDDFGPARIADIVRDAIDITRPRWRYDADAQGIKYNVSLNWQAAEDVFINCDPSELREVFVNIIMNALDAMPPGGDLMIGATANPESLSISFKDTGIGMSEEVKSRAFDPFFTTKGTAGLGLGLSESYRIVERHLGNLDIESQPGFGTTFTVTLPIILFKSAEAKRQSREYELGRKRFLVIDDEELVIYALAALLEELGHDVFQAVSAQKALELLKNEQFDLVFIDLAMPDLDGIATARKIKAIQPSLKIVLMSGYSPDKVFERIKGTNCIDASMSKPFRLDEVKEVVKKLIGEN